MNANSSTVERLGTLLAFGFVLIILIVGCYTVAGVFYGGEALFSFGNGEEVRPTAVVVLIQPTLTPLSGASSSPASPTPLFQPPTPAAPSPTTETMGEEPIPPTFTPAPDPTEPPTATPVPPTVALPSPTSFPTSTPAPPTQTPVPPTQTPVPPSPTPPYLFRVSAAGPDFGRGCSGQYIYGYVRNAGGAPMSGIRVRAYNQWGYQLDPASSKVDPPGWYDIPITEEATLWYVQVVDAANNPLSPVVEVPHTGRFVEGSEACWHQVDFARTN